MLDTDGQIVRQHAYAYNEVIDRTKGLTATGRDWAVNLLGYRLRVYRSCCASDEQIEHIIGWCVEGGQDWQDEQTAA